MADAFNDAVDTKAEKKRLKDERKKIKDEQKAQKKEARQRAKEISAQEAELEDEGGGISTFLVTVVIIIIWIGILCLLVKLDVGGFGSNVLAPVLKDVPVVNKILPAETIVSTDDEESYGGYTSLREAVDYIKQLELELEQAQSASNSDSEELKELRAEIERLQTFENARILTGLRHFSMKRSFMRRKDQARRNIRNIMRQLTLPMQSICTNKW